MFDVTDRPTLQEAEDFHEAICRVKETKDIAFLLVGNKVDLTDKRVVSKDDGQKMAKKLRCPYTECNAQSLEIVRSVFIALVNEVVRWKKENGIIEGGNRSARKRGNTSGSGSSGSLPALDEPDKKKGSSREKSGRKCVLY